MVTMSRATEDYLKTIYGLSHRGEQITTGHLARELQVTSPSASAMIKRLEGERLLDRSDGQSLHLTVEGERAALRVVRRHRLLETFLAQVAGVPWDEVHAEAELLEHALSDRLEQRIDTVLGHPSRDPHGDPIPPREGPHEETWGSLLHAAPPGSRFLVERIDDRDSAALRHLGDLGVRPGVVLQVEAQDPFDGPLWVRLDDQQRALGPVLTRLVHGQLTHPASE